MPTPYESAQLILKLFELRRDPVLRDARRWFVAELNPQTFDELLAEIRGPHNAFFRMVIGYWEMAASLVTFGAIDAEMFRAANTEILATFSKVHPFLEQLREVSGFPETLRNVEKLVLSQPEAPARLERLRQQFRERAAAARG